MNISALVHTHRPAPSPSSTSTSPLDTNAKKARLEDLPEDPPRLDREKTPTVDSHDPVGLFMHKFYGDQVEKAQSEWPSILSVMDQLLSTHGCQNCMSLRVGSYMGDDKKGMFAVICSECPSATNLYIPHPLEHYDRIPQVLIDHLGSELHLERIARYTRLIEASLSAKAGPSSIHSSRPQLSRKRSRRSSSPEQDGSTTRPFRDRLPPALRAHHLDPPTSLSDKKDTSSSLRSDFQAKTPAPSDSRPPRLATLSPSQKQELHAHLAERYDLTREDLNDDATVDMLSSLVIGAGSFLQPDALLEEEEETVQSNRLDPVPSFSTMRSDGPISTLSEAFKILELPIETIPLENWPALPYMKTSLTSAQICAAASLWKLMDEPGHTTSPTPKKLRGFMLCDAVGMGKTISALSVFSKDITETKQPRNTIVFCPAGLETVVWKWEVEKHMPALIPWLRIVANVDQWDRLLQDHAKDPKTASVVIMPFNLIHVNCEGKDRTTPAITLSDHKAFRVIVDEFQELRNARKRIAKYIPSFCETVKQVILLSGTPIKESACDLYAPLRMAGAIESTVNYGAFSKTLPKGQYLRTDWVRKQLGNHSLYMSRTLTDVAAMLGIKHNASNAQRVVCRPEMVERLFQKRLRNKLVGAYQEACKKRMAPSLDEFIPQTSHIFEALEAARRATYSLEGALRWVRSNQRRVLSQRDTEDSTEQLRSLKRDCTAKIEAVVTRACSVHRTSPHDKILIVGQSQDFIKPLEGHLRARGYRPFDLLQATDDPADHFYMVYDGQVETREAKNQILLDCGRRRDVKVLIGLINPISEGKNLQMFNHLYVLDIPRSPGDVTQLEGRLLRPGQQKFVTIHRFITADSPDDMYDMIVYGEGRSLGLREHPHLRFKDVYDLLQLTD